MFIHTDLLRAALCCVADQKEERRYLQGIHITHTHIQATNGHVCVSMEHGADNAVEGVFMVNGAIPEEAEPARPQVAQVRIEPKKKARKRGHRVVQQAIGAV